MLNQRIVQKLKTLQFNLDEINKCYDNSLRDTFLEVGLEYHKQYPLMKKNINFSIKSRT